MSDRASKPALRPYLAAEAPVLAAIFYASIEELAADDYTEAQQAAWAAVAQEETFAARLADQLTIVATLDGEPVGFASLRGNDHIDMLHVHPIAARRGVASALVDALEKLAAARGATALTVDASDTAAPLFVRRGYSAERRNTVRVRGEWLGTTTMRKQLVGAGRDP